MISFNTMLSYMSSQVVNTCALTSVLLLCRGFDSLPLQFFFSSFAVTVHLRSDAKSALRSEALIALRSESDCLTSDRPSVRSPIKKTVTSDRRKSALQSELRADKKY